MFDIEYVNLTALNLFDLPGTENVIQAEMQIICFAAEHEFSQTDETGRRRSYSASSSKQEVLPNDAA